MTLCLNGCGEPARLGDRFCSNLCEMGWKNRQFQAMLDEGRARKPRRLDE